MFYTYASIYTCHNDDISFQRPSCQMSSEVWIFENGVQVFQQPGISACRQAPAAQERWSRECRAKERWPPTYYGMLWLQIPPLLPELHQIYSIVVVRAPRSVEAAVLLPACIILFVKVQAILFAAAGACLLLLLQSTRKRAKHQETPTTEALDDLDAPKKVASYVRRTHTHMGITEKHPLTQSISAYERPFAVIHCC